MSERSIILLLGEQNTNLLPRRIENEHYTSTIQYNYIEKNSMESGGEPVKAQNKFWFDQLDIVVKTIDVKNTVVNTHTINCNVSLFSLLDGKRVISLINDYVKHCITYNIAIIRNKLLN